MTQRYCRFRSLIHAWVSGISSKRPARATRKAPARNGAKARKLLKPGPDGVVRLSGGNPQIAKGDGDAPVQAYLGAMPGWKSAMGIRLDKIITRAVPKVVKAVKADLAEKLEANGFPHASEYVKNN